VLQLLGVGNLVIHLTQSHCSYVSFRPVRALFQPVAELIQQPRCGPRSELRPGLSKLALEPLGSRQVRGDRGVVHADESNPLMPGGAPEIVCGVDPTARVTPGH